MKLNRALFIYLFFVCTISFGQDNFFQLSDQKLIVGLSSPRISPSGNQAVFIVTRKNFEKNVNESQLMWVDLKTKELRTLVRERPGLSQPQWLPDGSAVSFLANGTNGQQVFVLLMQGGEARQVSHSPTRIRAYRWHPQARRLAYIASFAKAKSQGFNDAFEVGSNDYLKTESSESANLFLENVEEGIPQKMLPDSITLATDLATSSLSWSPDGYKIAFTSFASARSGDSDLSKLQVLDLKSGGLKAITKNKNQETAATFSPDGRSIAFSYPRQGNPSNQNEIYLQRENETDYSNLTQKIDREILNMQWLSDGSLLVVCNDGPGSALWRVDLSGQTEKISLGDIASLNDFDSHGTSIVMVGTEKYRPNELYFKADLKSVPERITDFNNAINGKKLGKTEGFEWKSTKNLRADGVITFPPAFDPGKKYPLVLYVHGGPTAASLTNFHPVVQALASNGWIVFQPNYRGSSNLGNEFQSAIANDPAEGPGQDVMSGVNELLKRPYVDAKRVAISGWSYGGWMTAWMIGRYPDVWKTAVAGAAPVDLTDMYSLNDLNRSRRHAITDSPYKGDNLKVAYAQSPISNFGKIRTPTLIMSDTGDSRVTITGSYKLYGALRDNNVPVQFIAYPVSGHFPSDPVRAYDVYERWISWMKKYLDSDAPSFQLLVK